ncbi:MAG: response regulator [Lachnospiraceae bacterium]|jgi:CheY-like chemotaxis protein|nr:response regulator [Lachnospiraceae bacterium]
MERIKYFLLSQDEELNKLFQQVFENNLKIFSNLKDMQAYAESTDVTDGAVFFEYAATKDEIIKTGFEKSELTELSKNHFFKAVCLCHGTREELSDETIDYVFDVINLDERPEIVKKKLSNMRKIILMETIMNEVFDMSSFDRRNKITQERFNLFKMLSYIASVTYQKCLDKGITYELNIGSDVPEFLVGDRIRLNQIFLNLMTGAVQSSTEGGSVTFNVDSEKISDKRVKLKFVIEGNGFQFGATSRMIEVSHGLVEIEAIGEGRMRITIAFEAECDDAVEVSTKNASEHFVNMRVAAIGKDSKVREHTKYIFDELGFTTDCFDNMDAFRSSFIGKVLTGNLYSVCFIDGDNEQNPQVVKQLRAMSGMSSAIVIINTYNTDRVRMDYLRAGANAVVGKPISKTVIFNTIMQIVGRKISVARKPIKSGFTFVGKRVLVVDDNELSLEIAKNIIRQSGAICEVARDGAEAMFKFTTSGVGSYDLILMDIMMPGKDGCEATKEIRAMDRADAKIPIIALTSVKDDETHKKALEAGVNDVVLKPIDIKELTGVLNGIYN